MLLKTFSCTKFCKKSTLHYSRMDHEIFAMQKSREISHNCVMPCSSQNLERTASQNFVRHKISREILTAKFWREFCFAKCYRFRCTKLTQLGSEQTEVLNKNLSRLLICVLRASYFGGHIASMILLALKYQIQDICHVIKRPELA
jgi:hypothetical protein